MAGETSLFDFSSAYRFRCATRGSLRANATKRIKQKAPAKGADYRVQSVDKSTYTRLLFLNSSIASSDIFKALMQ